MHIKLTVDVPDRFRRFTDFKVNEIDLDGNVVELRNLRPPPPAQAPAQGEGGPAPPAAGSAELAAAYAALSGLEGDALAPLVAFLDQAAAHKVDGSQPSPKALTLPPLESKDHRRQAHALFKGLDWLPPLQTQAVAGAVPGGPQPLQVYVAAGRDAKGQKRKRDGRDAWAGGAARYVRFSLYKENMDTQNALGALARALHCGPKIFAVAGTKDKRAVTVQRVTAFRMDPARLAGLNSRLRGLRCGDFEFVSEQLRLGDLRGNRFDIVLRGVSAASADAVAAAAEGLAASGFINYFGLQRFGSTDVPTHRVGAALTKGEWSEAIRCIMAPGSSARPEVAAGCAAYLDDGDAETALRGMPPYLVAERAILGALVREGPTALVNALMAVPRNLRTMYLHAYQSFLWNAAASARVQAGGAAAPVAGDLVLTLAEMQRARRERAAPTAAAGGAEEEEDEEGAAGVAVGEAQVHVVTADEAAAGRYRIEDVVLPLPGRLVRYPEDGTAEVYRRVAAADGVDLEHSAHSVPEFSLAGLPGAYRHLVHRPSDLKYALLRYDTPDAELATTALQELEGKAPALGVTPDGELVAALC